MNYYKHNGYALLLFGVVALILLGMNGGWGK